MSNELIETIVSSDGALRNRSINVLLKGKNRDELLKCAGELESFHKSSDNLYHKVRASLFLFVIYRFYLQKCIQVAQQGTIPFEGVRAAFNRDFETSIGIYLSEMNDRGGINSAVCSAIADSYYKLSFKYLLDQVKLSISHCNENYHLYNIGSLDDYPFSVPEEVTAPDPETGRYPVGMDMSPVRLDPSHSGWSDIFFLGMDFPEGARVINLSVNLKVHGSDDPVSPPCECYCRFIEEPVIHLISVDLKSSKKISDLQELFNFGNDYLSLLKAGVVASGIIPPCFEKKDILLKDVLQKLLGKTGGIEVVTRVKGIPKGSRLAVSTTLLATVITRLMRFSGQIKNQTGPVQDADRRVAASRAILGEWLGGSGGGWQDSGGLWPGIKVITGMLAGEGHPEFGISRGCLLPEHNVFSKEEIPEGVENKILDSMVLIHGGISQDVGPVLEMVTEKYLLKYEREWEARLRGIHLFDKIVDALKAGDMKELGRLTTEDWETSIQQVIPQVNNAFTTDLIDRAKEEFGDDYWGFLMLGGMSGGGMAFIINPRVRESFKKRISSIMFELKQIYSSSFPFIIDPVAYDFELNREGIIARLLTGRDAEMPHIPSVRAKEEEAVVSSTDMEEGSIKKLYGFDDLSHEHMKFLLKKGDIGLARNRLDPSTAIDDVAYDDILHFEDAGEGLNNGSGNGFYTKGIASLKNNEVAVVSFAGGMGSRWTRGSAVVKPVNPFIRIENRYRTFIEIHLAKSRRTGKIAGRHIPHVFTTSYLTHNTIRKFLEHFRYFDYNGKVYLSPSKSIGRRVYPMERDLRFIREEQLQQKLDDNVQKVQDDAHRALIEWAKTRGEGEDYGENRPILRFNPPGHWYEIPNLIKNGVLAKMMKDSPDLKYLLCHNIDTLGAYIDPVLLGMHISNGPCLTFEVTPRRIEDAGGGLAKIDGKIQLIEGMALPQEQDEYKLSYYNTLTNWITIDSLLDFFGIDRAAVTEAEDNPDRQRQVQDAVRRIEKRIPTYVTIKNVAYLWGRGHEDIYPVAQFEKLWGDMTGLRDIEVQYVSVSRFRGLQLKEPSLLDMWMNDGSFDYVKNKCDF